MKKIFFPFFISVGTFFCKIQRLESEAGGEQRLEGRGEQQRHRHHRGGAGA